MFQEGNDLATEVCEGNLSEVRQEIQMALSNFHAHTKYTMTLMSTIVILAVGLLAYGLDHSDPAHQKVLPGLDTLMLVSGGAFLLLIPLAYVSEKICRRYYMIYASNYIYYARCHLRYAVTIQHIQLRCSLSYP